MKQNINTTETPKFQSSANGKSRRGFASMDKQKHKLVSSHGGKSPRLKSEGRINGQRSAYEGL